MQELEFNKRRHVPAFGSWDCNGDLPFTQCFETAREAGERDLYVAGDLYDSDGFTPAMIVVPRQRSVGPTYLSTILALLLNHKHTQLLFI